MVSSADLAGDVTVGVTSSADLAGDVIVGVAPSANLAGDVTVSEAPPADTDSVFVTGASTVEECQKCTVLPSGVGLSSTNRDGSFVELEAIVVGAVGTGAPWFLGRGY